MNKDEIKKTNKTIKSNKCYTFSPILEKYLNETLEVKKIRNKKHEAITISPKDFRKIRNNDAKKNTVLTQHIFRSMANLIYFFEFLNNNPELIDKFDRDVQELFGLFNTADLKPYAFQRFIEAILGVNRGGLSDPRFNFRRRLMALMQDRIIRLGNNYFLSSKNEDRDLSVPFMQSFETVQSWMAYLDRPVPLQHRKIKRKISF